MVYLITSLGGISHVFRAFRKTDEINSQQVYIKQQKKKKAEVTITAFTHRISDLYSLMAFWVIWVFAGSSPVWTAFLRAWSLKRYGYKFWVRHSTPYCKLCAQTQPLLWGKMMLAIWMGVQASSSLQAFTKMNFDRELFLLFLKKKKKEYQRTVYVHPCSVALMIKLLWEMLLLCISQKQVFF